MSEEMIRVSDDAAHALQIVKQRILGMTYVDLEEIQMDSQNILYDIDKVTEILRKQAAEIKRLREKVSNSTPLEWVDPGPEDRPEGWYWWLDGEDWEISEWGWADEEETFKCWSSGYAGYPAGGTDEDMRDAHFIGPIAPCLPPRNFT